MTVEPGTTATAICNGTSWSMGSGAGGGETGGTGGAGVDWFDSAAIFSNWTLIDEITSASSLDETYDISDAENIRIEIEYDGSSANDLRIRFNSDSDNNYENVFVYGNQGSTTPTTTQEVANGFYPFPSSWGTDHEGYATLEGILNKSGYKTFNGEVGSFNGTTNYNVISWSGMWKNSSDITSVTFAKSNAFSGKIRLYKWNDLKPVELHSYELVEEYNLNNEQINIDLDWDGSDDYAKITFQLVGNSVEPFLRFNNDSNSSNYISGLIYQDGSNVNAVRDTSEPGIRLFNIFDKGSGETTLFLTKDRKDIQSNVSRYNSGNPDSHNISVVGYWTDNANDVTSLQIVNSQNVTGFIRIYRLVKTHILHTGGTGATGGTGDVPFDYKEINTGGTGGTGYANIHEYLLFDTSAGPITYNLPANPQMFDRIIVTDVTNSFNTNNLTVGRNGSKIMGLEEDYICDVNGSKREFVYYDATYGWRVF